jgi:hypothetical protein
MNFEFPHISIRTRIHTHSQVRGMSERVDIVGANLKNPWALDKNGIHVSAWDELRAPKGPMHKYFCVCGCRDLVSLKRGLIKRPHFAYLPTAGRRTGCRGTVDCKETEIHYNAKWLLCDIFSQISFWSVCTEGHRISKNQYPAEEWTATVEKRIPGTKARVADVLLENSCTGKCVALEVYHTHSVGNDKERECKLAGVPIIEVKAVGVTPDCRDINNQANQHYWGDCCVCRRKDQERQERDKAYRIIWEHEERTRVQNAARKAEQERTREVYRIEQERAREVYRIEQERAREVDRIEQERAREDIRARKREERETERKREREREEHEAERKRERDLAERKRERDLAEIKRENDLAERKRERDLAEIKRVRESKQETVARQLFVNSIGTTVPQASINKEERVHRQFNNDWFK